MVPFLGDNPNNSLPHFAYEPASATVLQLCVVIFGYVTALYFTFLSTLSDPSTPRSTLY